MTGRNLMLSRTHLNSFEPFLFFVFAYTHGYNPPPRRFCHAVESIETIVPVHFPWTRAQSSQIFHEGSKKGLLGHIYGRMQMRWMTPYIQKWMVGKNQQTSTRLLGLNSDPLWPLKKGASWGILGEEFKVWLLEFCEAPLQQGGNSRHPHHRQVCWTHLKQRP